MLKRRTKNLWKIQTSPLFYTRRLQPSRANRKAARLWRVLPSDFPVLKELYVDTKFTRIYFTN